MGLRGMHICFNGHIIRASNSWCALIATIKPITVPRSVVTTPKPSPIRME